MRILSSDMAMQSQHASLSVKKQQTSISVWNREPQTNNLSLTKDEKIQKGLQLANLAASPQNLKTETSSKVDKKDKDLPPDLLKMKQAIESLMAWMSGRTVKMQLFSDKDLQPQLSSTQLADPNAAASQAQTNAQAPTPTWGAVVQSSSETFESESLSVGMQGAVTTADGRSINFNMSLSLSRQYYSHSSTEVRLGAALKDPLVVNFDGQAAQLSVNKVQFDLSSKGSATESLPELQGNSGYLAIDKNGNGKIDSGSELFGPNSGNAMSDLAALDEDKNGWIDEGDTAFAKLVVWQPSADGSQQMTAIGKLGIGAINTTGVAANFDYKDSQNTLQGKMKQAGMFLYEDGRAGTMQQIDIAA